MAAEGRLFSSLIEMINISIYLISILALIILVGSPSEVEAKTTTDEIILINSKISNSNYEITLELEHETIIKDKDNSEFELTQKDSKTKSGKYLGENIKIENKEANVIVLNKQ